MKTEITKPKITKILFGMLLCLTLFILWEVITKVIIPELKPGLIHFNQIIISRILFWFYVLAMWLIAKKVEKQPFLLWEEGKLKFLTMLVSVLLILLSITIASGFFAVLIKQLGLHQESDALKLFFNASIQLKLFVALTAAITEELIFRGYLISRLQLFFKNKWLPIIISAILFGLGHISYGTIINVIIPVFVGLVLGWHYQKYRNIKVLMACHFILDFSVFLFLKA